MFLLGASEEESGSNCEESGVFRIESIVPERIQIWQIAKLERRRKYKGIGDG